MRDDRRTKQAIDGGVEQQPELVGQEAVAAQAVCLELQLQFLAAVSHVTPQHLDVVRDHLGVADWGLRELCRHRVALLLRR